VEVLVGTAAVRDAILQGEVQQSIIRLIQEGSTYGMRTFDQHLMQLVNEGVVTFDDAKAAATSPADFELILQTLAQEDEEAAEEKAAGDEFVSRDFFPE
jgi:twitching motility protein PilT